MKTPALRTFLLSLLLCLPLGACSDDTAPTPDAAPTPDGAPATDSQPPADAFVGSDAVRPDIFTQPLPELGNVTLHVNLGDSIAAGYGAPFGSSYRELLYKNDDETYPSYQGKDLATRYAGISSDSHAVSGASSDEILGQAQNVDGNSEGDTLVTISIGGNDLLNDYQALLSEDKTRELAEKVKANLLEVIGHFSDATNFPGKTTIAIMNVYDPTDGTGTIPLDAQVVSICEVLKSLGPLLGDKVLANFAVFNAELRAFAESEGLLLVDISVGFLGHGFNYDQPQTPYYDSVDPTLWFNVDCIHPNALGHHHLREMIWHTLFGV